MIQKGIVEDIISQYEYKVRVPRYDKLITTPGSVATKDLSSAVVCSVPGTKMAFAINDIVIVDFENNELNKPIILGLLYRKDNGKAAQFNVLSSQENIDKIEEILDTLQSNKLYTHIKYSNDNGVTFTSLYEYSDVKTFNLELGKYKGIDDIEINPSSDIIYWSVLDSNGIDITSTLNITTTLYTPNDISESFSSPLIEIPLKFKGFKSLKLSFRILETEDYDNYHVVLTTDKNTLGSVYGNYVGVCVSTNPTSSLNPSDYSWMSIYEPTLNLIKLLENTLLLRIERNEKALYGYTYSTDIRESDGTGLLDGIKVEENNIYIYGVDNKNIIFNSDKSVYVDNENNNFITKTLGHTNPNSSRIFSDEYVNNGHLTLLMKRK